MLASRAALELIIRVQQVPKGRYLGFTWFKFSSSAPSCVPLLLR